MYKITNFVRHIWLWFENRWCIHKHGKTRQELIDAHIKEIKFMRSVRRIHKQMLEESADMDHYLYFGDRE